MSYSLLGILNINMPMLYGEGGNAFLRLQERDNPKAQRPFHLCLDLGGQHTWIYAHTGSHAFKLY